MVGYSGKVVTELRPASNARGTEPKKRSRARSEAFEQRDPYPWISITFISLLGMILIAVPLPMGANRIWAWTVLEMAVFGLVILWSLLCPKSYSVFGLKGTDPLLAVMGAWLLYLALYLFPFPHNVVQELSPHVYTAYSHIHQAVESSQWYAYFTLDRSLSMQALMKQGMYLFCCLLVVSLLTTRSRLKVMLCVLLGAGVLQVAVAVAARLMNLDLVPRQLLDGHWNVLRGTFVNRNHFASFLAMSAAAGIGLCLCYLRRSSSTSTLRQWVLSLNGSVLVSGASVVVVTAGMILSTSRGGVASLLCAVVLVLSLSLIARGWRSREMILTGPLLAALLVGLSWKGSQALVNRIFSSNLVIDERWTQWRATMDLVYDFWLTGAGPGLYQLAFTAYKSADLRPLVYDHAHNDYLELLAEQGVIGFVLAAIIICMIFRRLFHAFLRRNDVVVRGALFASLSGMSAMLIHSFVEFNFHIPANALYFWVLAGVGMAAARIPHHGRHGYKHRSGSRDVDTRLT